MRKEEEEEGGELSRGLIHILLDTFLAFALTFPSLLSLSISHNHDVSVRDIAGLASLRAEPATVLGHPAARYRSTTLALVFKGGKSSTGTGGTARHLAVAIGPDEGADTVEFAVWRQDDEPPDEGALLRIAEQVLPAVQGWLPATHG